MRIAQEKNGELIQQKYAKDENVSAKPGI